MVRDLEQIKENDESQLITKKEKSSSSNNGGHHCMCNKQCSSELMRTDINVNVSLFCRLFGALGYVGKSTKPSKNVSSW